MNLPASRQTSRLDEECYLGEVIDAVNSEIRQLATGASVNGSRWADMEPGDWSSAVVQNYNEKAQKRRMSLLHGILPAPYFGRIDFAEDEAEAVTIVYIGKAGMNMKPPVCDWRAPICSVFYQFNGPGRASYNAPKRRVPGELVLKRTYEIANGKLISIHNSSGEPVDPFGTKVDSALLALLSRHSSARMRQIVQSIQAEQDVVIRNEGTVLAVEGPAGSGKTVVALHRAAYLLYHLRGPSGERLNADQMLVVSPNRIFSKYISRVLPDLGEQGIRRAVPENIFSRQLESCLRKDDKGRHEWKIEQRQDFHEFLLLPWDEISRHGRLKCVDLKCSVALCDAIQRYITHIEESITSQLKDFIIDGNTMVASRSDLVRALGNDIDGPLTERLQSLLSLLKDRGKRLISRVALSAQQRNQNERWRRELREHWQELRRVVNPYAGRSLTDLYRGFWEWAPGAAKGDGFDWDFAATWTSNALEQSTIHYEDLAPMLLLLGLYHGFPKLESAMHAIIDEVQDYSPAELEYLRRCLPRGCHVTLVGDPRQTLNPVAGLRDLSTLSGLFGKELRHLKLNRGYRSSGEILEFAERICPSTSPVEAVRYTGNLPIVSRISDGEVLAEQLADTALSLLSSGSKTVAIICRTREEASQYHLKLPENLGAVLATSDRAEFSEGLLVLPIFLAKGLEFDAVIIPDASADTYSTEADHRLLYTACTRALHRLHMFCRGHVPDYLCA